MHYENQCLQSEFDICEETIAKVSAPNKTMCYKRNSQKVYLNDLLSCVSKSFEIWWYDKYCNQNVRFKCTENFYPPVRYLKKFTIKSWIFMQEIRKVKIHFEDK